MMRWTKFVPVGRWLILPPILVGFIVVAALAASRKELRRVEVNESALPVDFITVSKTPLHPQVVAYGSAEPNRRWNAIAEVGGRVDATRANLESGVAIREGEFLVSIDRSDYQLRLDQRLADLRQAESQLVQLKLNRKSDQESLAIQRDLLSVRANEVTRLQTLQNRSAASKSELDNALAAMLQQKQSVQNLVNSLATYDAQVESAEAAIALGRSRVNEAERDLDRTRIHSPFNGLLFGVDLEQGQYVAPGQTLFELIDTSWVEVEAQVSTAQWSRLLQLREACETPAHDAGTARSGSPSDAGVKQVASMSDVRPGASPTDPILAGLDAVVTLRHGEERQDFIGTPIRVTSKLDDRTRTIGVVVRVDNPVDTAGAVDTGRTHLKPGAYCQVTMRSNFSIPAFRVPRSAVEDGTVLCIGKDDRLRRQRVVVAFTLDQHVAVTQGLSESDRVVVNPPSLAMDGQLARPMASRDPGPVSRLDVSSP